MTSPMPVGATIPGVTHHETVRDGVSLHYAEAGTAGSPVVLVHGWPESWWAFHALIPLLAVTHRVYALDLRGFGDSSVLGNDFSIEASVEDLHHLVEHLGVGPIHVVCQDISGGVGFAFASTHADDVLSLTAVEAALSGFGLERFADVANGGSWHVGFLAAPGIPELLLPGHERDLLLEWAYPAMSSSRFHPTDADVDELTRVFSRPGAWKGTSGLYRSIFTDEGRTRALASRGSLVAPVLTIDGTGPARTEHTFRQVAAGEVRSHQFDEVGHLVAQEAPQRLAAALLAFWSDVDTA